MHILEQVCGALQATHARKIVHRDLKPENIFLCNHTGRQDFVKLLDFGVAKLERPEGRLTREGIALGTPEYMAPEQARGADVDGRTDLYAVGLHRLRDADRPDRVPGAGPRRRDDETGARRRRPRRATSTRRSRAALEAVVLRCLAKSPKARPQTALELAQELCAAVALPFDETGAFSELEDLGTTPTSGVVEMPALEVRAPRRRLRLPRCCAR